MSCSNLVVSRHVERTAEHLLKKKAFRPSIARWKLYYLIIRKHQRNWLVGNPVETRLGEASADLAERRLVQKMTDDHLAQVVSNSPGQHLVISVSNRITGETGFCRHSHH